MRRTTMAVAFLGLALGGCGGGSQQPAGGASTGSETPAAAPSAATEAATGAAAPVAFAQCMSCHSVQPGKNGIGPSLAGVFGRKAASLPGYAYSDALKASGLTWDEGTLDKWLTSPLSTVPGTKMTFAGIADPARRTAVIAYLRSLK